MIVCSEVSLMISNAIIERVRELQLIAISHK